MTHKTYRLFIGSTETFDAHGKPEAALMKNALDGIEHEPVLVLGDGFYDGEWEHTAVVNIPLESDAQAQRLACALAVLTRNKTVLVARYAVPEDEHPAFNSVRKYRGDFAELRHGEYDPETTNRSVFFGRTYAWKRDRQHGEEIAWLVTDAGLLEEVK